MTSKTEWARQRMTRMARSKSRNRLMETSFDSRTFSSSEDLDEVDRLANHPVLRSNSNLERNCLRKSRSESGDFLCKGGGSLSVWTSSSVSNQCSPMGYALPRSKGMIFNSKLSRSNTVSFHLNNHNNSNNSYRNATSDTIEETSPQRSLVSEASSNWVYQQKLSRPATSPAELSLSSHKSNASSTHYVVRAVIENATTPTTTNPSAVATFSPESSEMKSNLSLKAATPPSSAPLPNKFSGSFHRQTSQEVSSGGSNNDIMSSSSSPAAQANENKNLSSSHHHHRFLPLSLKSRRFKLEREQDENNLSSADSTPQRIVRGSVKKSLAPKPVIELGLQQRHQLKTRLNISDNSSNCSSAMSSLESVRSNVSDGVQSLLSTESSAVSSMSSSQSSDLSMTMIRPMYNNATKFHNILSPISDKSQEQCSEQSEHSSTNKTPKVSPVEVDNYNNNNNLTAVNDNDRVPWDMPKLRRRLINNLSNDLSSQLQGSDSGISIASQGEQDQMKELLNVPWDMPKLRKKTQSSVRPHSMPPVQTNDNEESKNGQETNCANGYHHHLPPPPPGFDDSGDEFYLSQSNPNDTPLKKTKKQRPKMTLSFGVDPSMKTLMFTTNSPFSLNDCEEVDPNTPLDRQDWYHGAVTRKEAENILFSHKEGSYLVRKVDSARQEFALSLKSSKGFMHMRIRRDPVKRDFQLSNFDRNFITVPQMIHHYSRNRLPIKGAEHMCLKKPVREQLL